MSKGTTPRPIRISQPMWDALAAGAAAEGTDRTKFLLAAAREKLAKLGIEVADNTTAVDDASKKTAAGPSIRLGT